MIVDFASKYEELIDKHTVRRTLKSIDSRGDDCSSSLCGDKEDIFDLADRLYPDGFVEKYCLSEEDVNDINIIRIIKMFYLKLYEKGISEIDLGDLSKYVSVIEELLSSYGFDTDIIFYKDDLGNYDRYKQFLVNIFNKDGVGYLDNEEKIVLELSDCCIEKWKSQFGGDWMIDDLCEVVGESKCKILKK